MEQSSLKAYGADEIKIGVQNLISEGVLVNIPSSQLGPLEGRADQR